MTAPLRKAFDELASHAPADSGGWAEGALRLARHRRRRAQQAVAAAVATVVVVTGALLAVPGRTTADPAAPTLPTRFDPPVGTPPSVLDEPIEAAVALVADGHGQFLVDAAGGGLRSVPWKTVDREPGLVVFEQGEACSLSLSPDGTRVAWSQCGTGQGSQIRAVETLVLGTGARATLPVNGLEGKAPNVQLMWSPDNAVIAVREDNAVSLLQVASGVLSKIPGQHGGSASWSPDSSMIAVQSSTSLEPKADVYTRDSTLVASVSTGLGEDGGYAGGSAGFGAENEALFTVTDASGEWELRRLPLDGGSPTSVAFGPELGDINGSGPMVWGWRGGDAVVQRPFDLSRQASDVQQAQRFVTFDLETKQVTPLLSVTPGTHLLGLASGLLDSAPLREVTTPAPPPPPPPPPPAPEPEPAAPDRTKLPEDWSSQATFADVTIPVPEGWAATPVDVEHPAWFETACMHADGTKADEQCADGILVNRITAASAASWTTEMQVDAGSILMQDCLGSGMTGGGFEEPIDGKPASGARQQCLDAEGVGGQVSYAWALKDEGLVLKASTPESIAAVRAASVGLGDGPRTTSVMSQGNGVTVEIPLSWTYFSRSTICLGVSVGMADACPLDGILLRGKAFFTGKPDGVRVGAHAGGPATPRPKTPLGYEAGASKRKNDIPSGCDGLAGKNYVTGPDTGGAVLSLRVQESRTISGKQADYYEWDASCPDGTSFTWRRWWVPETMTMFDSYDQPGGAEPAVVEGILADGITWSERI